jgi:hypothetical protein
MNDIRCGTCIYYKPNEHQKTLGTCIYSAPTRGDIHGGGIWPIVFSDQVCGKYCSQYGLKDFKDSLNECSE